MAEMEIVLTEELRALRPEDFIVPPDWCVRLVSTNFGKEGRRYPSGWLRTHGSYPASDADDYFPWGLAGEKQPDYAEHWRQSQRKREEEANKSPVRGNLREEQYRFWNGAVARNSEAATCRWCRHWAYGQTGIQQHQARTNHTQILREIYDCARDGRVKMCFVCGAKTRQERWGIPLCANNKCLNKWRVGPIAEISHTLLLYARWAQHKGLLKDWLNEDRSEKFNTEANPKHFNWDRANAY